MKVVIASDHAGFEMKESLKGVLNDIQWHDLGPTTADRVDYPDYAKKVVKEVLSGGYDCGILLCGSGQGVAMSANRFKGIRAALCWNEEIAKLARGHNDANILCLPSRHIEPGLAAATCKAFFTTPFEGGRHQKRVEKIDHKL